MIDGASQTAFADESLAGLGRIEGVAQHLEGDAAAGLELLGLEDRAHPAAAEGSDDEVVAKLFAGLRESSGTAIRGDKGCPYRAGFGLGGQTGVEEAFGAEVGRQIVRQFRAAFGAPAPLWSIILRLRHISRSARPLLKQDLPEVTCKKQPPAPSSTHHDPKAAKRWRISSSISSGVETVWAISCRRISR